MNKDEGYFHDVEKLEFLPKVREGLKELCKNNYKLIVIGNQSGIGRGYFTKKQADVVNDRIKEELKRDSIIIEKFYYCPHVSEDNCFCRKPKPHLILQASKDFKIDLDKSWLIGDTTLDVKMGENLKNLGFSSFRTILVKTGYAGNDKRYDVKPNYIAANLYEAAKIIIREQK